MSVEMTQRAKLVFTSSQSSWFFCFCSSVIGAIHCTRFTTSGSPSTVRLSASAGSCALALALDGGRRADVVVPFHVEFGIDHEVDELLRRRPALGASLAMVRPSNQPMAPSFGTTNSTGSFIAFLERAAEPDQ